MELSPPRGDSGCLGEAEGLWKGLSNLEWAGWGEDCGWLLRVRTQKVLDEWHLALKERWGPGGAEPAGPRGCPLPFHSFSLPLLISLGQAVGAWAPQVPSIGPSFQELPSVAQGLRAPGEALQPSPSAQGRLPLSQGRRNARAPQARISES